MDDAASTDSVVHTAGGLYSLLDMCGQAPDGVSMTVTFNADRVTCPACLKLLKDQKGK